mmetsp:Transcript_48197/g.75269  ORF Transcript_48197/g.75269 Transcript_48197/m.75269 type:complete len:160 (+) Transcript_48197:668-1147(+)
MRAAARQANAALTDEDPTTWLDNGRRIEEMLAEQNAVKVEYGPSPDLRFGCTLTVDLQRRILEVVDFDEKKGPGAPGGSPGKAGLSGMKGGSLSTSALNHSGAGVNELLLPDGTDYATFRRSLLAEGVDASALYRNSIAALNRGDPSKAGPGVKPGAMM